MATSYTRASAAIHNVTPEEGAWWTHFFVPSDELSEEELKERMKRFDLDEYDIDDFPNFNSKYIPDEEIIWISHDESIDLDHVAMAVQEFLRRFRPDDAWGMEYAMTCSKPRIGEFGGGAFVVTATEESWTSTSTWLSQELIKKGKK